MASTRERFETATLFVLALLLTLWGGIFGTVTVVPEEDARVCAASVLCSCLALLVLRQVWRRTSSALRLVTLFLGGLASLTAFDAARRLYASLAG